MTAAQMRQHLRWLGANVARLRQRHGWTQADLAHRVHIERSFLQKIERGKKEPSLKTVFHLASALEVAPQHLFPRAEPLPIKPGRPKGKDRPK